MSHLPDFIKKINKPVYNYKYSVCTLVTRREEYQEMLNTFIQAGFTTDICEYLIIDNSEVNIMDAYKGINSFLQNATGEYLIICHQDILLTETSTKLILDQRIEEMTDLDPAWGVLGNAGCIDRLYKYQVIKIAYPDGFVDYKGTMPQPVCSVDENFIVVKNKANLSLSNDIGGYHLYGLDLCIVAKLLGYSAYVIDFLLIHKSKGNVDQSFHDIRDRIKMKYTEFMKGRYINTTITRFYLSGSKVKNTLFDTWLFWRVLKTVEKIKYKMALKRSDR
jgi:hypothetical protein